MKPPTGEPTFTDAIRRLWYSWTHADRDVRVYLVMFVPSIGLMTALGLFVSQGRAFDVGMVVAYAWPFIGVAIGERFLSPPPPR